MQNVDQINTKSQWLIQYSLCTFSVTSQRPLALVANSKLNSSSYNWFFCVRKVCLCTCQCVGATVLRVIHTHTMNGISAIDTITVWRNEQTHTVTGQQHHYNMVIVCAPTHWIIQSFGVRALMCVCVRGNIHKIEEQCGSSSAVIKLLLLYALNSILFVFVEEVHFLWNLRSFAIMSEPTMQSGLVFSIENVINSRGLALLLFFFCAKFILQFCFQHNSSKTNRKEEKRTNFILRRARMCDRYITIPFAIV